MSPHPSFLSLCDLAGRTRYPAPRAATLGAIFFRMRRKVTIVVGAGSTLCDATNRSQRKRPPLDRGFFRSCGDLGILEQYWINGYLKNHYGIDPTAEEHDSLERVMAVVYADINNPRLEANAVRAFRSIIKLFNSRIAETTNDLNPTNRNSLYRIIAKKLKEGVKPRDLTIVTFNQDLQIEKVLHKLQSTKRYSSYGDIFCFPNCYRISDVQSRLTYPPKGSKAFPKCAVHESGICVLKLHGSLNWFSSHTSPRVPKKAILNSTKEFNVTPRWEIPVGMGFKKNKRTTYTFPLIVPPVNHKAAILHRDLHPIWSTAERNLRESEEIVVFGYSCPPTDFESANLLRRISNSGKDPSEFSVIDPNPSVFQRFVEVTNLDHLSYYRSAESYLEKG
ncbi:MAG: hypothetical protein AAGI48_15135 [Verrucomicrobiota bacterium]